MARIDLFQPLSHPPIRFFELRSNDLLPGPVWSPGKPALFSESRADADCGRCGPLQGLANEGLMRQSSASAEQPPSIERISAVPKTTGPRTYVSVFAKFSGIEGKPFDAR